MLVAACVYLSGASLSVSESAGSLVARGLRGDSADGEYTRAAWNLLRVNEALVFPNAWYVKMLVMTCFLP